MGEGASDLARWWHLAPSGQVVVNEQGVIVFVNRTLSEWVGQPMRRLTNRSASELFTPEARMLYLGLLVYRLAERGAADEIHLTLRQADDTTMPVLCSARQMDPPGDRLTLLSMLPISRKDRLERELLEARRTTQLALEKKNTVIAELEGMRTRLESQRAELECLTLRLGREAMSDALTGLPNRRRFEHSLQQLLADAEAEPHTSTFSVAILDIDHFKPVNDQHGHAAGDRALEQLASLLVSRLRGRDLAARIGGEEFSLLMPDTTPDEASCALERLRQVIAQYDWQVAPLTVSMGVTGYCQGDTRESLIARADAALYAAKREGRNRISSA